VSLPKIYPLLVLPVLLLVYGFLFTAQHRHTGAHANNISPVPPTEILDVLGHAYLHQLIAETLFIKTAVYYGGLDKQMNEGKLKLMGQYFLAMSQLHPGLLDIYYRGEAVLAHRGGTYTRMANRILENGRRALPSQLVLPFFEGFNYFYYLNDPTKAAKILHIASILPHSPKWIGHLASMLMARGGNIRTGLVWLKAMLATSRNTNERERYKKNILAFEQAMQVQRALARYVHEVGEYPDSLAALLPVYLSALPSWKNGYMLEYQPPKLFLRRKPRPG